jgi:hypothetical protein
LRPCTAMQVYIGSRGIVPNILNLDVWMGECSASRLCRFTSGEIIPQYRWIRG